MIHKPYYSYWTNDFTLMTECQFKTIKRVIVHAMSTDCLYSYTMPRFYLFNSTIPVGVRTEYSASATPCHVAFCVLSVCFACSSVFL